MRKRWFRRNVDNDWLSIRRKLLPVLRNVFFNVFFAKPNHYIITQILIQNRSLSISLCNVSSDLANSTMPLRTSSQSNQTSYSTTHSSSTCTRLYEQRDQSLWIEDWQTTSTMLSRLESAQDRCIKFICTISVMIEDHRSWLIDW